MTSPASREYHIGIVCALHIELAAMRAMLDEEYGMVTQKHARDNNTYFAGRIHKHNIVIASLPAGVDGVAAAAVVVKDMLCTFGHLRVGLLVGIGGGIPKLEAEVDIRLGDVVVSQPTGTFGGVVQYDKGKSAVGGSFERKGVLNAPPAALLTALQSLRAEHELCDSLIPNYLTEILERRPKMKTSGYAFPGTEKDILYSSEYDHRPGMTTCQACDETKKVSRLVRSSTNPQIHYGIIASGNQVVKDAVVRDRLQRDYGALCIEMEAAGLMNEFPCLVIRGISDYADSHKNDGWHRYAATTAAAYAKELLLHVSTEQTSQAIPILQVLGE